MHLLQTGFLMCNRGAGHRALDDLLLGRVQRRAPELTRAMNLRYTRTVTLISLSSLQPRLRNVDVRNVDLFVILKNNTRIMQRPRRKCVNSGANGFAVERNTATPQPNRARACVHVYYCGC